MVTINAPPGVKTKALKATIGIDSIHILIKMNKFDLARFCIDGGYKYKLINSGDYTSKWFIFLANGEPITATYNFSSHSIKFEIGKLLNYSTNLYRHKLTQQLFTYFFDRNFSIGKLDVAVDINMKRDDLIVKNSSKTLSKKRVKSTTYDNASGHVFIAYDKSNQLKIYSTNLTRLELRLNSQLRSWKITNFISNRNSFEKLIRKIDTYFRNNLEIYSNDGLTKYALNIDIDSAIADFIVFLHGGEYKYQDHFRIKEKITKRDEFFDWMKANKLTPQKINAFVKGRKASVCDALGLNNKTFKKAVDYYKSMPNFKF